MKLTSLENYISRRSPVFSPRGMVACSQPEAARIGVSILEAGGNAADAAIAVAAGLQVTQPCSTGLGGDVFCLYYHAASKKVYALNGSGRSPGKLTLKAALQAGFKDHLPDIHPWTVTAPGAPAAWEDIHTRFGYLAWEKLLVPAARLARKGFAVAPLTAGWWQRGAERQLSAHTHGHELMIDRRGPAAGEVIQLPTLADSLETLAGEGSSAFYRGRIAERITAAVQEAGGILRFEDLAAHQSEWVEPLSISYRGKRVWECPPNGQGLAVLIALNIIRSFPVDKMDPDSTEREHILIEAMRSAFADAKRYVGDPAFNTLPVEDLLTEAYGKERAEQISRDRRRESFLHGTPKSFPSGYAGDDTVYFCTADSRGNACSFINSNFMGFGTGIVPEGCGFSLQNRGRGFVLEEGHPNCAAPGKRPYHTIIPGMITEDAAEPGAGQEFFAAFGVMGGMMQPQGHLQVASLLLDHEFGPQAALDHPRFQLAGGAPEGRVLTERLEDSTVYKKLQAMGHPVEAVTGSRRSGFGLGQVIVKTDKKTYCGGSDSRGDGTALSPGV